MKKELTAQRTKQITIGIILLVICALVILLASKANTMEDGDITAVAFLVPLGLYMIFTKEEMC